MIARIITGVLLIGIGIFLIYIGQIIGQSYGIMSPVCQNLTWQGYFEDSTEWVAHDSCIIGNYTWDEECYFILPWWEYSRCLNSNPSINHSFWSFDRYFGYEYNESCDKELWVTNYSQMQIYNTRCVSSPFVKAIPLLPGFFGAGLILLGIAALVGTFFGKEEKADETSSISK